MSSATRNSFFWKQLFHTAGYAKPAILFGALPLTAKTQARSFAGSVPPRDVYRETTNPA